MVRSDRHRDFDDSCVLDCDENVIELIGSLRRIVKSEGLEDIHSVDSAFGEEQTVVVIVISSEEREAVVGTVVRGALLSDVGMLSEVLADVRAVLLEDVVKRDDESVIDGSLGTACIGSPLVLDDIGKVAGNLED